MGAIGLSSTTLAAAISQHITDIPVASSTGITVGMIVMLRDEAVEVLAVSTGLLKVRRGHSSQAKPHPIRTLAYFGTAASFRNLRDGTIALGADPGVLPEYLTPGKRARDGAGNEYILVDLTGTVYGGTPVQINSDYTAAKVGTTGRGLFGVTTEQGTSDEWVWAQIFGRCKVQLLGATAGVSPSDDANGPTTLSTSAQTKFWLPTSATSDAGGGVRWTSGVVSTTSGYYISRMYVAHDASPSNDVSLVTAATSHTGSEVAVFLNYPEIVHMNYGE